MLLLEGIGTIVFGLWVMSQGTGPGASILILIGLPVVLFGVVLTIVGFAKFLKEETPVATDAGLEQSPRGSGLVRTRERQVRVRPEQEVQERTSKKKQCPECGAKYGLFDLVAQPTMCSKCWKKSRSSSIR